MANVTFWLEDNNNKIVIDNNTTMEGGSIAATEGTTIKLGEDCMLSYNIDIRSGDSHGILTLDGNRINHAKDIVIEPHVWIGASVTILKGTKLPTGSIVGHSSVVTSEFKEPNSIYAGNPARLIRKDIQWIRER